MVKRELNIFLTAIMFYTRIPVPKSIEYSSDMLNKATRYFPLIGLIVGGLGAGIFWCVNEVLSQQIAVVSAIGLMIIVTGAFHEDAISDFCDGFGGGYTKEKILSIMKDSRIGTYGAVAIILFLLSKYVLLTNAPSQIVPLLIIAAHAISRLLVVGLIYCSRYVGVADVSKSKPIGHKNNFSTFLIALIIGIVPLFYFEWMVVIPIVLILLLMLAYFRYYIHKIIDGYTGDVLGAFQQIAEVSFYFLFLIFSSIQW